MKDEVSKVLMLNYEYPPLGGGAATATENILRQYKDNSRLHIDLVTSSSSKYKEKSIGNNIKIFFLDIDKTGDLHSQSILDLLKYSYKAYFFSRKLLKKNRYDLIHAFFGIPSGFIALLLNKPYIVSLRGSDVPFYSKKYYFLDLLFFKFLSGIIWKKARFVVANSTGLKNLAVQAISDVKIGVIPNGVDTKIFNIDKKGSIFSVVSTSRLIKRKGIDKLVKGFSKFASGKKGVSLQIFGNGEEMSRLKLLSRELGVEKIVFFYGDVSRTDLAKKIRSSHVFVLPSENEGMSNSLLEAMASGLVPLVTDVGGTRELINNRNGFVLRENNEDEISDLLEKLYKNRSLLSQMSKEARVTAEKFDWRNVSNYYHKLYKRSK